jgi:hypothetical protein
MGGFVGYRITYLSSKLKPIFEGLLGAKLTNVCSVQSVSECVSEYCLLSWLWLPILNRCVWFGGM